MGATANEVVAGIGNDSSSVLDVVTPTNHINLILSAADSVRRTRPDATYTTARYCTPSGAGAHDGTSLANAWSLSELNTALATTGSLHVYMVGTFEPATYSTAGPMIKVVADNVRLDFATYSAVMQGYSGLTWTASGVNGEYWATVGAGSLASFRITEDGVRMQGVNNIDGSARMTTTAINSAADTITLNVYRELQADDLIALISSAANGLSQSTAYYVKTASALSGSAGSYTQTITLSSTVGGATFNLTGTTASSFFSLVGGRDGDPVPGSLEAGQYAWAPHEARLYIKPSWGTPDDHTYTFWQTSTEPDMIRVYDSGGTCNNCEIVGGEFIGSIGYAISLGESSAPALATAPKVYGTVSHACKGGITIKGAANADIAYNVAYDISEYAFGSNDVDSAESALRLRYNWGYDIGTQLWDEGDSQGLVMNPQSDGAEFIGNVIQRLGHIASTTNPVPLNGTLNYGAIVCDSSFGVRIVGNYIQDCIGDVIELGPNDYQAMTYFVIAGNVIDLRGLETISEADRAAQVNNAVVLNITDGSSYGHDYTNIIEGNLFLLGDKALPSSTNSNWDNGAVYVRNTANTAIDGKIKTRNNVFIFTHPTAPWNVYAIRLRSTRAADTGVDSDFNTYYTAYSGVLAQWEIRQTTVGQTPSTTAAFTALGDGVGWTAPDGTVNDKHSTIWSATDFIANFNTNPTVLRCLAC